MTDPDAAAATGAGGWSGDDATTTWRAVWNETAALLGERQQARWICEVASSTEPDEFLAMLEEPPTMRMMHHLDAMVARARSGEPLQYVLGRWGFRRLDLAVDSRVLIPRPETELVAEVALDLARSVEPERTIFDLGTGSGAIGLSLADELPLIGTSVWLTDASAEALDVARSNLAGIGRAAQNVRIAEGSWFAALPEGLRADVIVSNPPYVAVGSADIEQLVSDWEPAGALFSGSDGLDDLRVIIGTAHDHLKPDGWLVLEIGADQGDAVLGLLAGAGFVETEVRHDLAGLDRTAIGRRP